MTWKLCAPDAAHARSSRRFPFFAVTFEIVGGVASYLNGKEAPLTLPALSVQLPPTVAFALSGPA
jgi:hypothetical protein